MTTSTELFASMRRSQRLRTLAKKAAFYVAVIGGLMAFVNYVIVGGFHLLAGAASTPAPAVSAQTIIGHSQLAGSFGEQFVVAYLTTPAKEVSSLKKFITSDNINLPTVRDTVSDPKVVYTREQPSSVSGVELWSVTVSVRVHSITQQTPTDAYYRVPVSLSSGAPRAVAIPSKISGPSAGVDLPLGYPNDMSTSAQFSQLVTGFFTAYLTHSQDLTRYITADSGITPISGAPDTSVKVEQLRSTGANDQPSNGATAHLLVTVSVSTVSYNRTELQYPITAVAAGGQWQIASIDSVPVLGDPNESNLLGSASTPTTTTSTPTPTVTAPPAVRTN